MKLRFQLHLLVVTAIVIPTLLLLPSRSDALLCCDDDPIPTPAEALEFSDLVFRGTVSWIETIAYDDERSRRHDFEVWFEVTRVWKGSPSPVTSVLTWEEGACGFAFLEGEEYVVYARGRLVSMCGRTTLIQYAEEDLAFLGPGQEVGQDVGYPSGGSGGLAKTSASATNTGFDLNLAHLPAFFAGSSPDDACRAKTRQR